jgi:osmoprotectant transport system permease protein
VTYFFEFLSANQDELVKFTLEHVSIILQTLVVSSIAGIALGVLCARVPRLAAAALGITSILLTIPSYALFGYLALVFGYTDRATIAALTLYSLLPITRNTYVGLTSVEAWVIESARGMGMSERQVLLRVRLPIAAPVILAGIRQATVLNVAIATVGAAVASGGLGTPIFRGIQTSDYLLVLVATVLVASIGLLADAGLAGVEAALRHRLLARLRARH